MNVSRKDNIDANLVDTMDRSVTKRKRKREEAEYVTSEENGYIILQWNP